MQETSVKFISRISDENFIEGFFFIKTDDAKYETHQVINYIAPDYISGK